MLDFLKEITVFREKSLQILPQKDVFLPWPNFATEGSFSHICLVFCTFFPAPCNHQLAMKIDNPKP